MYIFCYSECLICDAYDPERGCEISPMDRWYACSVESRLPENQAMIREMIEFYEGCKDK